MAVLVRLITLNTPRYTSRTPTSRQFSMSRSGWNNALYLLESRTSISGRGKNTRKAPAYGISVAHSACGRSHRPESTEKSPAYRLSPQEGCPNYRNTVGLYDTSLVSHHCLERWMVYLQPAHFLHLRSLLRRSLRHPQWLMSGIEAKVTSSTSHHLFLLISGPSSWS
jgi:hypothetical protein